MATIFILIFLVSIVLLPFELIRPSLFQKIVPSPIRKKLTTILLSLFLFSIVGVAMTGKDTNKASVQEDPVTTSNPSPIAKEAPSAMQEEVKSAETEAVEVESEEVENSPTPSPTSSPTPTHTPIPTSSEPTAVVMGTGDAPVQETYLVTRVIDGDTIVIEGGMRVRYIGIDTSETVHPNRDVECFGREASAKNKELVEGKRVRLVKDVSDKDHYGRLLRYIYVGDVFVNDYLVRQGYANATSYPPDVRYADQFRTAEQEARNNNRGLWGICNNQPTSSPSSSTNNASSNTDQSSSSSNTSETGVVKKSENDICHAPGTTYYNRTKNFTPYNTIDDCLNSGGRLPLR